MILASVVGEIMAALGGVIVATGTAYVAITKAHTTVAESNHERTEARIQAVKDDERTNCDKRMDTLAGLLGEIRGRVEALEEEVREHKEAVDQANARAWRMRNLAEVGGVNRDLVERTWQNVGNQWRSNL